MSRIVSSNISLSRSGNTPFPFARDEQSTLLKPSELAKKALNGNTLLLDQKPSNIQHKITADPKNNRLSLKNRLAWSFLGCCSIYNLIDAGLARLLALETLTHGTSLSSYIKINLWGADPRAGGSGSAVLSSRYLDNSKNYFHVFKDTGIAHADMLFGISHIIKKIAPRMHATLAGYAGIKIFPARIINSVLGFFTPTIKFRFTPDEMASGRFTNDPDYSGLAWRTSQPISAKHIGITGSITQGIGPGMFSRMKANPGKVLRGVILLSAAAFVFKKTYSYIKANFGKPTPMNEQATVSKKEPSRRALFVTKHKTKLVCAAIFLNLL